ncbi:MULTISPECIES: IS200/IS605 family transposase [Vibrio]|uniref:IS200/IS605 family transposase n=1 Tax=Vibrio TaxID=662 RepID=UPI00107F7C58|nr:IS200/IS605 family transposase [Vibrio tasmaniensis]
MQYYTSSHSVYYTKYHVVWVTKYCRQTLNPGMCSYLRKVMPKLLRGVEIETIGFDEDLLHMIMLIPPKYSISDVMGKLKSQSSYHRRKTFSRLSQI